MASWGGSVPVVQWPRHSDGESLRGSPDIGEPLGRRRRGRSRGLVFYIADEDIIELSPMALEEQPFGIEDMPLDIMDDAIVDELDIIE